jgi:hypothetical protein
MSSLESDILHLVKQDDVESLVELGLTKEEKLIALKIAVEEGSVRTLKFLVKQVDPRESTVNLLFLASQKRNVVVLKELCSRREWKHQTIESAYAEASRNQFHEIVNTIYSATGYWPTPPQR